MKKEVHFFREPRLVENYRWLKLSVCNAIERKVKYRKTGDVVLTPSTDWNKENLDLLGGMVVALNVDYNVNEALIFATKGRINKFGLYVNGDGEIQLSYICS